MKIITANKQTKHLGFNFSQKKKTLFSIPKYFYSKKKKILVIYLSTWNANWMEKKIYMITAIIYLRLYPFFPGNPRNDKWIDNKKRGKNVYLLNCLLLKSRDEIVSKSSVVENEQRFSTVVKVLIVAKVLFFVYLYYNRTK